VIVVRAFSIDAQDLVKFSGKKSKAVIILQGSGKRLEKIAAQYLMEI
jgi:hypothetical protein